MHRCFISALLAGVLGLTGMTHAIARPVCRPALAVTNVDFSEMQRPTLERRWTAVVTVDASRCQPNTAGYFEIGFVRLIENGVDIEFAEEFIWMEPAVKVSVDFWANEAVAHHWINSVSTCPCAR
jgi:hypothetical protein